MKILEFLGKKAKKLFGREHKGHVLTEEDRQKGAEIIQMNAKINLLERQLYQQKRLQKLEDAILKGGSNEQSLEAAFISQILPMLLAGKPNPLAQNTNIQKAETTQENQSPIDAPPNSSPVLSNEEVKKIAGMLKPYTSAYSEQIKVISDTDLLRIRAELIK